MIIQKYVPTVLIEIITNLRFLSMIAGVELETGRCTEGLGCRNGGFCHIYAGVFHGSQFLPGCRHHAEGAGGHRPGIPGSVRPALAGQE